MAEVSWEDRKKHILARLAALENERQSWDNHCKDIAMLFQPRRSRFLSHGEKNNDGEARNFLETGYGIKRVKNLAAVMQSGISSPSQNWFSLSVQDTRLAEVHAVKVWLDYILRKMSHVFRRSNFYSQIQMLYAELVAFGTGVMFIEDDTESTIRCRTLTFGEYCLDMNAAGRIDTIYRRIRMTPRQIVEAWPETAPDHIRNLAEKDNYEWQEVIHAIEPNPDYREGSQNKKHRKYSSIFMMKNGDHLEISGYFEFPVFCARWDLTPGDVYGSSPCMDALSDCRQLQKITYDGRIGLEKNVNPPLMVTGLQNLRVNASPGAMNPVSSLSQGHHGIQPLYMPNINFAALTQEKNEIKQDISEALFNDLLLLISGQDKSMTATEVDIKNNEKLLLLGPVLHNLYFEFQLMIERVYGIMDRMGEIPEAPPEMDGQEIKVEFISILALGQKMSGKAGIVETMTFIGQAAQLAQDPGVVDKLNVDEAINEFAAMNGVPPGMIRPDEEVAHLRQARQQQQQMAQMMEMARQGVDIAATGAQAAREVGEMGGAQGEANETVQ